MVQRDYVFALSRFGMSYEHFLDLTPVEFYDSIREKEKHEQDLVLSHVRIICETIRLQTLHLVNLQLPRGKKVSNLKKLMLFKWETEPQPAQTMQEMKGIMKALAKGFSKKKKDGKDRRRSIRR